MPPPCPPGIGAPFLSSGISETSASVVSISDAIDPALVSAVRTAFVERTNPESHADHDAQRGTNFDRTVALPEAQQRRSHVDPEETSCYKFAPLNRAR